MGKLNNNRIRTLVERMSSDFKEDKVDTSTQNLVRKMRKLNEQEEEPENQEQEPENQEQERVSMKTPNDQKRMEDWFDDAFRTLDVFVKFDDLEVYNDFVFWSGMINGVIKFVFKVTENPEINGVEFQYSDDIDIQNPKNNEIIEKLEQFYKDFSNYWLKNLIQT